MRRRPPQPESPLVRLLRDPAGELHHLLALIQHALAQALPYLGALAGLALALTLALWLLRRQRARRLAEGARLVRIAVPPELDPQAAGVLWKSLHDLLRPPLARLLQGQPHLAWEIAADRAGSAFRLWLPRAIPPGLVERALLSAWPGAGLQEDDAAPMSSAERTLISCALRSRSGACSGCSTLSARRRRLRGALRRIRQSHRRYGRRSRRRGSRFSA